LLSLSPAFPEINRDHRALTFLYGTEDRQDRPGSEAVRYRHNATARLSSHCGHPGISAQLGRTRMV
jgi:hypothetical protein